MLCSLPTQFDMTNFADEHSVYWEYFGVENFLFVYCSLAILENSIHELYCSCNAHPSDSRNFFSEMLYPPIFSYMKSCPNPPPPGVLMNYS